MKELKFRAWDKRLEEWCGADIQSILRTGEFATGMYDRNGLPPMLTAYSDDSHFVVMRYTGHESIDGSEVYDGDLLKFPEDEHIYKVTWLEYEGMWGVMYNEKIQLGSIGLVSFMQVCGNIYQNPELLKEQENGRT